MTKSEYTPEEELVIIEEGLKSQFWAVYSAWLQDAGLTAIGSALSERVERREWMAGQASGLKRALKRPVDRVRELRTKLEQSKK